MTRVRDQRNEALRLTMVEMSQKIRRLQRVNSALRVGRDKWRARARAAERRVR